MPGVSHEMTYAHEAAFISETHTTHVYTLAYWVVSVGRYVTQVAARWPGSTGGFVNVVMMYIATQNVC